MEKWRSWWWCKNTLFFPTKRAVFSITSCLTRKTRGRKHGLVNLHKDMESCRGYGDIEVMWEILHSSCPPNSQYHFNHSKSSYWRFCFRPT